MEDIFDRTNLKYRPTETLGEYEVRIVNEEAGRGIRNAQMVSARVGVPPVLEAAPGEPPAPSRVLPVEIDALVSSFFSGIPGEGPGSMNAKKQGRVVKERAGVPSVANNPALGAFSGGRRRTRRGRKSRRKSLRQRK